MKKPKIYSVQRCIEMQAAVKQIQTVQLPVKLSYRLSQVLGELEPVVKRYQEQHNALIKQYGEETPQGGYQVAPHHPEYNRDLMTLLAEEETVQMPELPFALFEEADLRLPTSFFSLMREAITQ